MAASAEPVDDAGFVVTVEYEVQIFEQSQAEEDEEGAAVGSLAFAFAALYRWGHELADVEERELDAFAVTTGTMALYPYAREYVADMTGRLGLPTLTMPVRRLPSPWHPDGELTQPSDD
jgi:preprotein translocase subunit SecB